MYGVCSRGTVGFISEWQASSNGYVMCVTVKFSFWNARSHCGNNPRAAMLNTNGCMEYPSLSPSWRPHTNTTVSQWSLCFKRLPILHHCFQNQSSISLQLWRQLSNHLRRSRLFFQCGSPKPGDHHNYEKVTHWIIIIYPRDYHHNY